MDSGGGGNQVQQVNSDPWSGQQDYLTTGYAQAKESVLDRPTSYYPESTVVPFAPETETALGLTSQRALAGNPLTPAAQSQAYGTLTGKYLQGGNPEYAGMVERSIAPLRSEFQNVVMPQTNSMFAAGGRYGSPGGHQAAVGRATDQYMQNVGNVTSGLAYQNYGDERSRQLQTTAMAPELAAADYQDISMLGQAGTAREQQAQAQLQDSINRYGYEQQEPTRRLADYMAMVGGGTTGGQSTTSTQGGGGFNPVLGTLGAGAATAGIMSSLFGGTNPVFTSPWG